MAHRYSVVASICFPDLTGATGAGLGVCRGNAEQMASVMLPLDPTQHCMDDLWKRICSDFIYVSVFSKCGSLLGLGLA